MLVGGFVSGDLNVGQSTCLRKCRLEKVLQSLLYDLTTCWCPLSDEIFAVIEIANVHTCFGKEVD